MASNKNRIVFLSIPFPRLKETIIPTPVITIAATPKIIIFASEIDSPKKKIKLDIMKNKTYPPKRKAFLLLGFTPGIYITFQYFP